MGYECWLTREVVLTVTNGLPSTVVSHYSGRVFAFNSDSAYHGDGVRVKNTKGLNHLLGGASDEDL